jgi:REP-associated tyrosine transposase
MWGKATALECIPHAIGGMPNHIHVAISIPPKLAVAILIGQLKGASSHHVNKRYADGSFLWQAEYGVVIVHIIPEWGRPCGHDIGQAEFTS